MNPLAPSIEILESRIALSTLLLLNATTAAYTDVDGDKATVHFSKPILTAGNIGSVFTFGAGVSGDQLQKIELGSLGNGVQGTSITVTAHRAGNGDGMVNVGFINANNDLGAVTIGGNLDELRSGDADSSTTGLKSLKAQSLGLYGTTNGAISTTLVVSGAIGSVTIKNDVKGLIEASGLGIDPNGKIGKITIGGNLVGGAATDSGRIIADGNIGTVKIGGDIVGGSLHDCGSIYSVGNITSMTVGGSIIGGTQQDCGSIITDGNLKTLTVGGSLIGGTSGSCGIVNIRTTLGTAHIGGDLRGSTGGSSGAISAGTINNVVVNGSLLGNGGNASGGIQAEDSILSVKIGSNVIGGSGVLSGSIMSYGTPSGTIGKVSIGGDLIGGSNDRSGSICSDATATALVIRQVNITGSVIGGSAKYCGGIFNLKGSIGTVKIGQNLHGGSFSDTGDISSTESITSVTIGGSLVGGTANYAGRIVASGTGALGSVKITHDIIGGDLTEGGFIFSKQGITSIAIGGSLRGGAGYDSASIFSTLNLGSLTIGGSVTGTSANRLFISAEGVPSSAPVTALGKLSIKGSVENALITAGFDLANVPSNAGASIGPVTVGGNWIASNLIAGKENLGVGNAVGGSSLNADNVNFGDSHDFPIGAPNLTTIASIVIGGQVLGTLSSVNSTDHFGFVAEQIGSFKIGNTVIPLNANGATDNISLGTTGDVNIHEI